MLAMGRLRSVYSDYTLDKLGKDKEMFHIRGDIVRRTRGTHTDLEAAKRLVRLSISCQINLLYPGHVHHSPGQCPCSHEAGPNTVQGKVGRGVLDMVSLLSSRNSVCQSSTCMLLSRLEKQ